MKPGCGCGCLSVFLLLALAGGVAGGAAWVVARIGEPPEISATTASAEDGRRAQQKIYEISRGGSATLSDRELNAVVSRHLTQNRLPLAGLVVGLPGDGEIELAGQVPLTRLTGETLGGYLPARWSQRRAWIMLRGRPILEPANGSERRLRLDVREWRLGRQRLPVWLSETLLDDETLRVLRWPLPNTVESVRVDRGRVSVRSVSGR